MFFYCLRNYFNSKCSLEKVGGCPSWGGLEQHQAFRGGSSIRRQEHGGQLTIEETDIYILLKPPFSCMHVSLRLKIYLIMLESHKGAIRELPIGAEALWLRLARSWGAGRVLCALQVGLTFKLVIIMVRVIIFIIVLKLSTSLLPPTRAAPSLPMYTSARSPPHHGVASLAPFLPQVRVTRYLFSKRSNLNDIPTYHEQRNAYRPDPHTTLPPRTRLPSPLASTVPTLYGGREQVLLKRQ